MVRRFGSLLRTGTKAITMDISKIIISDDALDVIDNGAWVGDLDGAQGLELKVTGLNSKEARSLRHKKHEEARAKNDGEPLTADQMADCLKEVIVECVLKDWRGLTDGGKEVKYSRELAKGWIQSRNGELLADLCVLAARRVDGDAQSFVETAVKN